MLFDKLACFSFFFFKKLDGIRWAFFFLSGISENMKSDQNKTKFRIRRSEADPSGLDPDHRLHDQWPCSWRWKRNRFAYRIVWTKTVGTSSTKTTFCCVDWEKENGKTFLVGGVNFMEYIAAQKEEHIQQLEAEKIQREQVGKLFKTASFKDLFLKFSYNHLVRLTWYYYYRT